MTDSSSPPGRPPGTAQDQAQPAGSTAAATATATATAVPAADGPGGADPVCTLKKSISNASSGGLSVRSYQSISSLGTYTFGSLHVHDPDRIEPIPADSTYSDDCLQVVDDAIVTSEHGEYVSVERGPGTESDGDGDGDGDGDAFLVPVCASPSLVGRNTGDGDGLVPGCIHSATSAWVMQTHSATSHGSDAAAVASPADPLPSSPPSFCFEGDVVIMLGVPAGFTVGVDTVAFTVAEESAFHGLKNLPAGPHFFWLSEGATDISTRSGLWVVTAGNGPGTNGKIVVCQWDQFNAVLGPAASHAEERFQRDSIAELFPKLVAYDELVGANPSSDGESTENKLGAWERLTSFVTPDTLARITGSSRLWTAHTADPVSGADVLRAEFELDRSLELGRSRREERGSGAGGTRPSFIYANKELRFSFKQTEKTYDVNSVGAERTRQALDSTTFILNRMSAGGGGGGGSSDDISSNNTNGSSGEPCLTSGDVIGELQVAFVLGTHLGNDACINQWRFVVLQLVLRAFTLPANRPHLAADLLICIASHFRYANDNFAGSTGLGLGGEADGEDESGPSHPVRLALGIYKKRLDELRADARDDSPELLRVFNAFGAVEAAVLRLGWDLRDGPRVLRQGRLILEDGESVELDVPTTTAQQYEYGYEYGDEEESGEYAPVVVGCDKEQARGDFADRPRSP